MMNDVEPDPHDCLTFRVTSRTDPKRAPYVVQLTAHDGRGECNCTDWSTRRRHEGTCKHVRRSREAVTAAMLSAAKRFPQFAEELHRMVRLEWEREMENT